MPTMGRRGKFYAPVARVLDKGLGLGVVFTRHPDVSIREQGQDWPPHAETMIGWRRLDNLQRCIQTILEEGIAGDFIEAGVWRGGAAIFMRGILAAYEVHDRTIWVADSFEGIPRPNAVRYPADAGSNWWRNKQLVVSLEEVKANFRRYGLLDHQVQFLRGWFKDTLPNAPLRELALMRLDGDLYESTMDALKALYPRLSHGGFIIVDDYALAPCRKAINDYREANSITEPIHEIDWTGVFWRRATLK